MNRRDFLGYVAAGCAAGVGGGLLPGTRISLCAAGGRFRISGGDEFALAPLREFVAGNGLQAPPPPGGGLADFKYLLQEWRSHDGGRKVAGFSREFGYLRVIRRRDGDATVYNLDRSESATRIRAKLRREGGPDGRLSWDLTQSPRTPEGEALGLVTEVAGSAGGGRWERTVNGRRESGECAGAVVADCELLTGGLDFDALAGAGIFTFFSHEACFQGQAECRLRRGAPVAIAGPDGSLQVTPFGLTGARHQPQHYLVAEGRGYASAFTEFAVSMTLDSLS